MGENPNYKTQYMYKSSSRKDEDQSCKLRKEISTIKSLSMLKSEAKGMTASKSTTLTGPILHLLISIGQSMPKAERARLENPWRRQGASPKISLNIQS